LASEVPLGAGLSSSAALEVSFATALEGLAGEALPPQRKALLCQQAEHEFAGVPCGIMDQFAAVFGRAGCLLLLDCRSRDIEWIPFPDPSVCLLIANTNVRHALADGEYAIRRQQCSDALTQLGAISWREVDPGRLELFRRALPDPLYRRAKHVVTEIARTRAAAQAIRVADWDATRRLMAESHASLRDDYEVSCPELDCLVDIAADLPGVLGTRMTGGGFGGSTVSLVRHERLSEVEAALRDGYLARTGVEASLFVASPGDGASLFPIPGRPPLEAPES
jgi:galactokinase